MSRAVSKAGGNNVTVIKIKAEETLLKKDGVLETLYRR